MYNATDYILSGLFLQDIEKNHFQTIIFETKETIAQENKNSLPILSLYDVGLDFSARGKLVQHINDRENTLLVLDKLNIHVLENILTNITTNLTIINCNAGISSAGKKLQVEKDDITFLTQKKYTSSGLFEPFDIASLLHIIQKEKHGITYVKVANKDYTYNIMQNNPKGKRKKSKDKETTENFPHLPSAKSTKKLPQIIDLTTAIPVTTKPIASIACGGSMLPAAIQACTALEKKKVETDLFIIFDWEVRKNCHEKKTKKDYASFLHHVSMTKKLIIICDHEENENLKTMRTTFLNYHHVQAEIFFITPEIAHISTILSDYIYEQAKFDGNSIAGKIEKILS